MKVIVDTNVIISALLSLITSRKINIFFDQRILLEYLDVIKRKKFGFKEDNITEFYRLISKIGININSDITDLNLPDEGDLPFFELFSLIQIDYLITGNTTHFPKMVGIVNPKEFLTQYHENS